MVVTDIPEPIVTRCSPEPGSSRVRVGFWLESDVHQEIQEIGRAWDRPVSWVIRKLLLDGVREITKDGEG